MTNEPARNPAHPTFTTKDSGQRQSLANGMVRDVTDDKIDWTLILDGPLLERYAQLLSRGAKKYGKRNWTLSFSAPPGPERAATLERFRESAMRHFVQWVRGDLDEDHAAAVVFNLNGYEAMR